MDKPVSLINRIKKYSGLIDLLGYFTRGFAVMLIWGILAAHFGIPTLGYWYSVALVYVIEIFINRPPASIRFMRYINDIMKYHENIDELQDMEDYIERVRHR